MKGGTRKRLMKLVRDYGSSISPRGTGECPRRRYRANRRCDDQKAHAKMKCEMSGRDLLSDERRLYEDLCTRDYLVAGFQRVRKNKGAPGIDGVTIAEFETRLDDELSRLTVGLESWTYKPSPVRRVEIPKPGGQGIRLLGVSIGFKKFPGVSAKSFQLNSWVIGG